MGLCRCIMVVVQYNSVITRSVFFKSSQKTHHSPFLRARYRMSFWARHLIRILTLSLQCCMQHRDISGRIITALDCMVIVAYTLQMCSLMDTQNINSIIVCQFSWENHPNFIVVGVKTVPLFVFCPVPQTPVNCRLPNFTCIKKISKNM